MANMVLDLADPAELSLAARELPFPQGVLNQWLPTQDRPDHRWQYFRGDRRLRAATPLRPWDTPAVPVDRAGVEEVMGRMLPSSNISWLLEEEKQKLDSLRSSGAGTPGADVVLDVFNRDLLNQANGIRQRLMLMQGQAVATGSIQIGSAMLPENGLQLPPVDFGFTSANSFTAATLFSAPTPNILGQLTQWKQVYSRNNGGAVQPAVAVTSTRVLNTLVADPDLRTLFASVFGTPQSIGSGQLNQLLSSRMLPELVISDDEVPDIGGTATREFPDDRIIFLPAPPSAAGGLAVGATQWGVTEEAKVLAQARLLTEEQMPGMVAVPMASTNPVRTGLLVAALAMPVITDPNLIMTVKVL